ncbi:MAG: hypothetical protein ACE5FF_13660 [Saprospiraceae bacterium]
MKTVTQQQFLTTKEGHSRGNPGSGDDHLHLQISAKEEREILRQFEAHVAAVVASSSQSGSSPRWLTAG